jgi:hypothetical protein
MCRLSILLVLLFSSSVTSAASCPEFFRFVDFGQIGNDGVVYRSGSFFRAEDFDGSALLDRQHTECIEVSEANTDGHGYSIPVVTSINYNPVKAKLDVLELRVSRWADTHLAAEDNAVIHRQRLDQSDVKLTQGEDFLCVHISADDALSCQVVSPYEGNHALVVYCDSLLCEMPVMAVNEYLSVSAKWSLKLADVQGEDSAGTEVVRKIAQIHGFLKPITSLNPQ